MENEEQKITEPTPTETVYTEKQLQSEVDKRVRQALDNHKEQMRKEAEERARLTAEEKAQKDFEERVAQLESRERDFKLNSNKLSAKEKLVNAGIPTGQIDKMLSTIVSADDKVTETNVQSFIDVFNATKEDLETKLKNEYSKIPAPKSSGASTGGVTKEALQKMSYGERLKFKQENPDLYKQLMK